jgi:prepilin-type N-terminal cleavage/methylation domain-containing protein
MNANYNRRRGFTMVELLVVISIIVLLAGMALGAMAKARERGKLEATKATVAKLNDLVMKKYTTYASRRVPFSTSSSVDLLGNAGIRLVALRCLMQMEMPQCWTDITNPPLPSVGVKTQSSTSTQTFNRSALSQVYLAKFNKLVAANNNIVPIDHQQAKCLYIWLTTAMPEAKALFRPEEIKDVDSDGFKCFVDGWGNPIGFLRWAPGASAWSDIQVADATVHHDPLDPLMLQNGSNSYAATMYKMPNAAYQLYPLIFAGVLGKVQTAKGAVDDYGIALGNGQITGDPAPAPQTLPDPFNPPFNNPSGISIGSILPNGGVPSVTNHHMEAK